MVVNGRRRRRGIKEKKCNPKEDVVRL